MDKLTRRQIVTGSAALALGATMQPPTRSAAQPSGASAADGEWIELECAMKEMMLDGHRVRLRAYNDQIPGPTITVTPGQTLRIRLKNALPPYDSSAWGGDHNVPHGLDETNLHLHGMDVIPHLFEPVGTSEMLAPMISIPSGGVYEYVFDIPKEHPPGLNWYHPHKHGSTAVQAVSGMAGPIIVTGALDDVPEIKAARQIPLVIQDIGLFPSEDDPDLWTYEPKQNAMWDNGVVKINGEKTDLRGGFTTDGYELHYYLLNGEPFFKETPDPKGSSTPVGTQLPVQRIKMAPGEVVLFKILNGNSANLMPIVVDGHDVHLIAMDGVNLTEVRTIPAPTATASSGGMVAASDGKDSSSTASASSPLSAAYGGQLLLAPANRAEFMIKASTTPGIYKIRQIGHDEQHLPSAEKIIAEIEVTGEPKDMALPGTLPTPSREYPLMKAEDVKRVRTINFGVVAPGVINKTVGVDFVINNALYGVREVPTVVNLGDVEEWHLSVGGSHNDGHPFHMHVNSFEVVSINGVAQPPGLIQDTIWVETNSTVVIRVRFKGFVGKAVYHCHILPHEDTGMMQNILIVDGKEMSGHGGG